jgi:hypothetical protein
LFSQIVDLQNELKMRIEELRAAQDGAKKLASEKELLEQKINRAEKKKLNEVGIANRQGTSDYGSSYIKLLDGLS